MIRRMYRKNKTDVLCIYSGGKFSGFAATINGDNGVLLDYLAVKKQHRGRGTGSAMMNHLITVYGERGLFVEIENAFERDSERSERMRRRNFYLKNGMQPMNVFAYVFGVNMELLGCGIRLTFEAYREFYRSNYSDFAAKHILPAEVPPECGK